MSKSRALFFLSGMCLLFLQGCLYTGHHFNTGELLKPGKTHWELGAGNQRIAELGCDEQMAQEKYRALIIQSESRPDLVHNTWQERGYAYLAKTATGEMVCRVDYYAGVDTVKQQGVNEVAQYPASLTASNLMSLSLGWRLGVRNAWGPFTGVDLGWRLEAPTGPVTLEFDARFGLPMPESQKVVHHNLSLGWGLGMWADNSLFGEYAVGWGNGTLRPFGSTRITYLATQPSDLGGNPDFTQFESYRRWVGQLFVGCEWYLPKAMLLPGRLMPTVSVAWPALPFVVESGHVEAHGLDWRFALGIGANL
jgi:hypothetical protein